MIRRKNGMIERFISSLVDVIKMSHVGSHGNDGRGRKVGRS